MALLLEVARLAAFAPPAAADNAAVYQTTVSADGPVEVRNGVEITNGGINPVPR